MIDNINYLNNNYDVFIKEYDVIIAFLTSNYIENDVCESHSFDEKIKDVYFKK